MSDVCKKYGKREGYSRVLNNWAYPNRWTERIMAYQDFVECERAKQRLKVIEEMDERQAKNGILLQQQGILFFQQNAHCLKLSEEQAMRYIEVGSRIERTARGVPTEIRAESELLKESRKWIKLPQDPEERRALARKLREELDLGKLPS
jgi:hypothetical protein